jgi:hypothetical protein
MISMGMPAAPTWEVEGSAISQSTELGPGGTGIVDVYTVPYKITGGPAKGHTGVVKIDADNFSADSVRLAVNEAVATVHDVASLSG